MRKEHLQKIKISWHIKIATNFEFTEEGWVQMLHMKLEFKPTHSVKIFVLPSEAVGWLFDMAMPECVPAEPLVKKKNKNELAQYHGLFLTYVQSTCLTWVHLLKQESQGSKR